jgi:arabinogalactan oligomer/maltooligosaccharide transport system permease protein
MTKLQYLSLTKPERVLVDLGNFFRNFGKGILNWFKSIPLKLLKFWNHTLSVPFKTLEKAMTKGNWWVRGNFLVFGLYQIFHKEIARGILYLLYEVVFIWFFIRTGLPYLQKLGTLGTLSLTSHYMVDPSSGVADGTFATGDNSFTILLYSIVTIFLALLFVVLWYFSIRDAKSLYDNTLVGKMSNNKQFFKDLVDSKYHTLLLAVPLVGLVAFTIIPIIFMVTIGFTNYNGAERITLFDWVGFDNYSLLFSGFSNGGANVVGIFFKILAWTLLWALIATFTNYFLGMVVALLINKKGIKLKKLWRTVLIFTIAVPQFVSLMLINRMLDVNGFLTDLFVKFGWVPAKVSPFQNATLARVIIIVINTWVGVPYTMLISSGILMNIPEDLYESARIDGASSFKMYRSITLPYMLFITGPYLLSQFVGNINNFNIIYLLSHGEPSFSLDKKLGYGDPGETDLLITWIYKMSMESGSTKNYAMACVLGVLVFLVIAFFSLIFYGRTGAVKNEEDFS